MPERTADIERGRDAARREAWAEAYEELASADPSDLSPEDLEALSDAAWWLSKMDEAIAARQQAYTLFIRAYNDARRAVSYLRAANDDVEDYAPTLFASKGTAPPRESRERHLRLRHRHRHRHRHRAPPQLRPRAPSIFRS